MNKYFFKKHAKIFIVIILGVILSPSSVSAQTNELPLLVVEKTNELISLGCERVLMTDSQALLAMQKIDWQAMIPSDATGEAVVFCDQAVAGNLISMDKNAPGKVAGVADAQASAVMGRYWEKFWEKFALNPTNPVGAAAGAGGELIGEAIAGKPAVKSAGNIGSTLGTFSQKLVADALSGLFGALAFAGELLTGYLIGLVVILLTLEQFITRTEVTGVWPIVLGITNLGFMLVLLTIALFTTLRIEVGGGIKRLLPRLLISALLVNFSLVIAGLILDASRILMALMPSLFGMGTIEEMGGLILKAAKLPSYSRFNELLGQVGGPWAYAGAAFIHLLASWVIAAMAAVVAFGLMIRYGMLILLLIVSPIPYLAIVLPGTSNLAKKWWSAFIKYVLYGPVVLFVLLIAAKSSDFFGTSENIIAVLIASTLTVAVLMFLAAKAGSYAGMLGAGVAMTIAGGAGKRARATAYRGAKGTGRLAGTGARKLGKTAADASGVSGLLAGRRQALDDRKKAKEKAIKGGRAAQFARSAYSPSKDRKAAKAAKNFEPDGSTKEAKADSINKSEAWSARQLRRGAVGGALRESSRRQIIHNPGVSRNRREALAGNPEAIRNMTPKERDDLDNLETNRSTTAPINLQVDLPTVGVSSAQAATNTATNSANRTINETNEKNNNRNKELNEINKGIRKAYFEGLKKLNEESKKESKS